MSKKSSEYYIKNLKSVTIKSFLSVFKINLIFIILFGAIGYYIDALTNTKPLITIIFIMISMPLSIFTTYKNIKKNV